MEGDSGWSADGTRYGFCAPLVAPDAADGCLFFDRNKLEWSETGRREALKLWQPWKEPPRRKIAKPLLPVHPLDAKSAGTGEVVLKGRVMATDDVVLVWRSAAGVEPDEAGSQWRTIFDYSPDGEWLAAGAVRVDLSTSANAIHVIVRPVRHWLVLAGVRAGAKLIGEGDLIDGIGRLADAGALFDKALKGEEAPAAPASPAGKASSSLVPEEALAGPGMSWIEKKAAVRWSPNALKLCACDAWQDERGGDRASCRAWDGKSLSWAPFVTEKLRYLCPAPKPAAPAAAPPVKSPFAAWVDWGRAGDATRVFVYLVGAREGLLGAVLKKDLPPPGKGPPRPDEPPAEALSVFHPVLMASPVGPYTAAGFAVESWDHASLRHYVEVHTTLQWEAAAKEEQASFKPAPPRLVEKVSW